MVLHLGCGLDTRYFRLAPASQVLWYDVDYPEVISLRSQVVPAAENVYSIGSSVTDLAWLEQVPADRPVLMIAEGLVVYLEELPGRELIRAIVERFPSGQLIFDSLSSFGVKMQRFNRAVVKVKAQMHWGMDGVAELESISPRLRCVTAMSAFDLPGYVDLKPRFRSSSSSCGTSHGCAASPSSTGLSSKTLQSPETRACRLNTAGESVNWHRTLREQS